MSTPPIRAGVFANVIAHVSGEVRVDPSIEHRAPALAGARATSQVGRRRRSRAAGLSINLGPRPGILIPAP